MALMSTFTSFNLPVNNVERSKAFFTGLGFELNPQFPENEQSVAIMIGDNLQVMLLTKEVIIGPSRTWTAICGQSTA